MEKKNYSELLKDPRWQKKRLEIMQRDDWSCQHCGERESQLHVHHKYYDNGKYPWDYPDGALITLCDKCHEIQHGDICDFAEIGKVYTYEHGDYTNYMICYDIDVERKLIYLFGVDNGSGHESIWFDEFTYDFFLKRCTEEPNFIKEEKENFFSRVLFNVFVKLINGDYINNKSSEVYVQSNRGTEHEVKTATSKKNVILKNNSSLNDLYKKYKNGETIYWKED